ncbi:MAG: hypothetical protein MK132_04490 [Lentisphaerales bacterium]|nr:hypothetical protein [Lentisphaerales bacterium]
MKDIILKNIEKVLLTLLLIVLAVCSVYMISTMDKEQLTIVKNDAGVSVKVSSVPEIQVKASSLEEEKPQPYDSKGYIYCRSIDCNYLIHRSLPKCPWCNTDTKPPPDDPRGNSKDADGDGIKDADEIKFGLNPEDASDAFADFDAAGYANIDEIEAQTDIKDADDHPSIITRTNLHYKIRKQNYYPITFANFGINNEADKKTWDIYADIFTKRGKRSIFKRVNDKIDEIGYTIIDVDKDDDGREYIMIQKEGEGPVKIPSGKNKTVKNVVYALVNGLTGKLVFIELNESFELVDKNGNKEKYKATKFDRESRTITIIDYKMKDSVKVGLESLLKEPGERKDSSLSLEDELLR